MYNELSIKAAAESPLRNLQRTSFSEDGFTDEQIDAISEAISNAIATYDSNTDKEA